MAERRGVFYRGSHVSSRAEKARGDGHGRYGNKVQVFTLGRVCAADGCNTALSIYNRGSFCSLHAPPQYGCGGPRILA